MLHYISMRSPSLSTGSLFYSHPLYLVWFLINTSSGHPNCPELPTVAIQTDQSYRRWSFKLTRASDGGHSNWPLALKVCNNHERRRPRSRVNLSVVNCVNFLERYNLLNTGNCYTIVSTIQLYHRQHHSFTIQSPFSHSVIQFMIYMFCMYTWNSFSIFQGISLTQFQNNSQFLSTVDAKWYL